MNVKLENKLELLIDYLTNGSEKVPEFAREVYLKSGLTNGFIILSCLSFLYFCYCKFPIWIAKLKRESLSSYDSSEVEFNLLVCRIMSFICLAVSLFCMFDLLCMYVTPNAYLIDHLITSGK